MGGVLFKQAFLMPFSICVVISMVILWYFATRNPIRRFRPPLGQVLVGAVVLFMVSGGLSFIVAKTVLEGNTIAQQMKEARKEKKKYQNRNDKIIGDGSTRGGSWDRIMGNDRDSEDMPLPPPPRSE
jgi:hypothetical protein